MRPELCGPHASRIVWPAFTPACKPALALALAPAPARPARPRLGGCVRSVSRLPYPAVRAGAFPACPTACSPSRLFLLSGAARPVSLAQTMMVAVVRTAVRTAHPNSRPRRFFSRDGGAVGRCPPHARACQVWGLGVATGAANPFEIARVFRVRSRECFFLGSAETSPLVVLRKKQAKNRQNGSIKNNSPPKRIEYLGN